MFIYILVFLLIFFLIVKEKIHVIFFLMKYFDIISWEQHQKIKVYIPENNKNSELVKQGFEEWSTVTKGNISFDYVTKDIFADIKVVFQNKFNEKQVKWYDLDIGQTYCYLLDNLPIKINKMEIIIVDRDNIDGTYLKKDQLYNVIVHEIGHALGLWRHSYDKNSVMYKSASNEGKQQNITQEDIKRLRKLYKF